MKINFLGAAQTVTGSCHMLEAAGKRFCIDCGMHQGNNEIEKRNWDMTPYDPENIDFILLTHAHIDHSGLLPRVVKNGFSGPIYATPPTKDLLEIMLLDSAHIQEMEAEWTNLKRKRQRKPLVEPLYVQADAEKTLPLFTPADYNTTFEPAPGIKVTYRDAGHILGSAFLELCITEDDTEYNMIFSGDLGRPDRLILQDPDQGNPTDFLFIESTYGDRNHKDVENSRKELAEAIAHSYSNGEKVIIPAFAVERSQEIIYTLFQLSEEGKLPGDMPIFLDSPLAIRATEIFRKHTEYMDQQTRDLIAKGKNPLDLPNLKFTLSTEESKAINEYQGTAIIISASGMCNAGRIRHHLRHNLWRKGASVVFVGYQAMGTPGRRIVNGADKIRIHNEDVAVNAKIFTIGGFSAHAGQSEIIEWLDTFDRPDMQVFLVHGEHKAQKTLGSMIEEKFKLKVHIPAYLDETLISPPTALEERPAEPGRAKPRVDWGFVFGEVEGKLAQLQEKLEDIKDLSWEYQTDFRDRLLEINTDLTGLISEL